MRSSTSRVPGDQILGVLRHLLKERPSSSRKPMGRNLNMARGILAVCRERRLMAAVNFQLRFSPNWLGAEGSPGAGSARGDRRYRSPGLSSSTPWQLWSFSKGLRVWKSCTTPFIISTPSVRLPESRAASTAVWCRIPALPEFRDTRSSIILDYGASGLRCSLALNHMHEYDPRHRASMLKVEGTKGAAILDDGREPGLSRRRS